MKRKSKNKIIVVLSAGIKKNKSGNWISTDLSVRDCKYESPGGKLRIWAAYYMWLKKKNLNVIASGGRGHGVINDEQARPDLSTILKNELIELGVNEKNIIEENRSNKTHEQLLAIDKFADKKFDKIFIITNDYHVNRVKAMIKYLENLCNKDKLEVVSAEKICIQTDSKKWKNVISRAYSSQEMAGIIASEKKGIKQIKEGTYEY